MSDFVAVEDRSLLERHDLASFEALWVCDLAAVDAPNQRQQGWSRVCRLVLDGRVFFLKRQVNYLTRSLSRPWGEPTFAREFRNIRRYARLGIPALQATFFGERKIGDEHRAILLTPALPGRDLEQWLSGWDQLLLVQREAVLQACGKLARQLHAAGQKHGCFYPKHLFLHEGAAGLEARLIDLEKSRRLLPGRQDRLRDLDTLLRRASVWNESDVRCLINAYLGGNGRLEPWLDGLGRRHRDKAGR